MKRRKVSLILTIALILLCTACGKETEKKEKLTGEDAPEKVIEAASKQYGSEKKRGTESVYTYTFMDGSSETEKGTSVFDVEKAMQQMVFEGDDNPIYRYNVKEGDSYYTYELNPETNAWVRYKQEAEEGMPTTYEYQAEGKVFDFDEKYGYINVDYSNEGKEDLNGVSAIKIKMTGEESTDEGETEEITRESILKDYELTEEVIGYIDGLSEALDKYVEAMNASSNVQPSKCEAYLWVEADTHRPLRIQETITLGNVSSTQTAKDMEEFEDNSWKAYNVMADMEEGLSLEEALENVKNSEADMEAEIAAEKEMLAEETEGASDDDMTQKEVVCVDDFVYGEDCAQIEELPEHYTEITQEEYFSGEY